MNRTKANIAVAKLLGYVILGRSTSYPCIIARLPDSAKTVYINIFNDVDTAVEAVKKLRDVWGVTLRHTKAGWRVEGAPSTAFYKTSEEALSAAALEVMK